MLLTRNRGQLVFGCLVVLGAVLVCPLVSVLGDPQASVTKQGASVVNPHWRSDQCSVCHSVALNNSVALKDSAALKNYAAIRTTDIDAGCLQCHDGVKASPEAHPIGRRLDEERFKKPSGWPMPDGRLTCSTCHDMELACRLEEKTRSVNSNFLRGNAQDTQASFCANCHVMESHERLNAHRMIDASGKPDQAICAYCHTTEMEGASRLHRRGEANLKVSETTLCLGCHSTHIDYFEPGHMGSQMNEATRKQLKSSGLGQRLPLVNNNTVTCSTCHNPHEAGVFAPGSELEIGALNFTTDSPRPKLRGLGKEICSACHAQ